MADTCSTFRAAWNAGQRPDLTAFLGQTSGADRKALFDALAPIEVEARVARGEPTPLADLAARFPELVATDEIVLAAETQAIDGWDPLDLSSDTTSSLPDDPATVGPQPADPYLPEKFGRYTIRGVLGSGGFGTVYRAHDEQLGRDVAIKTASAGLVGGSQAPTVAWNRVVSNERFAREARRLARLRHPGIVTVFDVGVDEGRRYIVSDLVEGRTLSQWLRDEQPDWQRSARLVAQVADALAYAHAQGIIHRDVKPDNILVHDDGTPVLVDFGIAVDGDEARERRGEVIGSPGYMSPEQLAGHGAPLDGRTDIYGLGVVFYELICGRPAHSRTSLDTLRTRPLPPPPAPRVINKALPPIIERICLRAIAESPDDRYASAADMAVDLEAALGPGTGRRPAMESAEPLPEELPGPAVAGGWRTPLVGRDAELAMLESAWRQAESGSGRIVLLAAAAGVGKSRLLDAFRLSLRGRSAAFTASRCAPEYTNSVLHAVVDLLRTAIGFQDDEPEPARRERLRELVTACELPEREVMSVLSPLLGLESADDAPYLSPGRRKQVTLEALSMLALASGDVTPQVLVIEDLHWMDPTSLEWIELLMQDVASARLLVVLSYRPSFRPPWPLSFDVTQIALGPLADDDALALARATAGGQTLGEPVLNAVLERAEGVPLFVEELTRAVLDAPDDAATDPAEMVPTTLQESIATRLSRLGSAGRVVSVASVIGRQFGLELLKRVAPKLDEPLDTVLARLVDAEILRQRGRGSRRSYLFAHALMRDVAHDAFDPELRAEAHRRIAVALEADFEAIVAREPEVVAHHFTEAGLRAEALPHWVRAARAAVEASANREAVVHLEQAIDHIENDDALELELLLALGAALASTLGYGAPAVERTYQRAHALCDSAGEHAPLFRALRGLWQFHSGSGAADEAARIGDELLELAEESRDTALLIEAHRMLGANDFWAGEFRAAHDHLESAVALYDPALHANLVREYGQDPGVANRGLLAWTLAQLGRADDARAQLSAALAQAETLAHPYSRAFALGSAMWLHYFFEEPEAALEWSEQCIEVSAEHGFAYLEIAGRMVRAWAIAVTRPGDPRADAVGGLVRSWQATGSGSGMTMFSLTQARVLLARGRAEEALALLSSDVVRDRGASEQWLEPEVHRLTGLALAKTAAPVEAVEAEFALATRSAEAQGAVLAQLRIALVRRAEDPAGLAALRDTARRGGDFGLLSDAGSR